MSSFNKTVKLVVVIVLSMYAVMVAGKSKSGEGVFDWDPIMDAITQVESEGNEKAKNGTCIGSMQIKPILVADCNEILKSRGEKKRFKLSDRLNSKKSREMFVLIMSKYNPENDIERAIRIWNGGVRYKVRSTQKYYQKVMAAMAKA